MSRPKKPCAACGHGKSKHGRHSCNHTWTTLGQTFMGNRQITKYCTCTGFTERWCEK